jgi:3-oxoacyl-[acyl-carrier-protein] synthase II
MRKVVITGMGTINPIAKSKTEFLESLKNDKIGISTIDSFDTADLLVKFAGQVKDFNPKLYMDRRKARKFDRFLQLGLAATKEAFEDSGLLEAEGWCERTAVTVSSGIGGANTELKEFYELFENGPRYVSPFLIPMIITNMIAGVISMEYGLNGPSFATVSACASSLHSMAIGAMLIESGKADVVVTGGVEAAVNRIGIVGFSNMMALSKRNDDPERSSRPFDKDRDGFVLSEGSGVLIFESEEFAMSRNADIYGYVKGYGMSSDAHDYSASDPDGKGPALAMKRALADAKMSPSDIELVSAHATGTPVGDISEGGAIKGVFGDLLPMIQATKSLIGHTIAGSGAIETIGAILQSKNNFVHGMPNLKTIDEKIGDLNYTYNNRERGFKTFMKNSFGFGGQNASIIIEVIK